MTHVFTDDPYRPYIDGPKQGTIRAITSNGGAFRLIGENGREGLGGNYGGGSRGRAQEAMDSVGLGFSDSNAPVNWGMQ